MEINDVSVRYLQHRMRTEKEMRNHLIQKEFEEEDINIEIERLKKFHYIDDVKYTTVYVRYSIGKRKAFFRIKRELANKGVSTFDIEDGIYNFEEEENKSIKEIEMTNALREAEKIVGDQVDRKKIEKLGRRLDSLGYSVALITTVLEKYRG